MVMANRAWTVGALVLVGLILTAASVRAELTCRADVDRRSAAPGGQIVLTLHASGDMANQPRHVRPRIEGVEVVPGGTSQSFHMSGSRSENSVDITYYLVVRRQDDFQIPAVAFSAGNETCSTEPIAITVTTAASTAAPATGAGGAVSRPGHKADPGGEGGRPGDPHFITLEVDRGEVWLGQQVILTFRYHHRKSAWSQPSYTAPRTEGFWRVDLPPERNYRRNISGYIYDVTEIRYALFPTRSGELTVDPARLEIAGDPFDRFFGRRTRSTVRLRTQPMTVTVKDLPLPRPERFSGIVADRLAFTATVDRDTVPRGEPLSLRLQVTADGFLKSFGGVPLDEPDGVRLHDAAENLREDVTGPRYEATFSQEKAAVPSREGTLTFPSLDLIYFDTGKGQYATSSTSLPPVVVTPSDLPTLGEERSGFRRTEIARLGNDLAFIHPLSGSVEGRRLPTVGGVVWWVLALAPWAGLLVYRGYLGRLDAERRDPVGLRRRRALTRARQALAQAAQDQDADALARVIATFVADRAGRPVAGIGGAEIRQWAASLGEAEAEAGCRLADMLEVCDGSRFGGQAAPDVPALARELDSLLPGLVRDRQRGKPGAATALGLLLCLASVSALATGGADPARLMAEGNQAYTEGDLDGAVTSYREAIALGGDAAELHYNLANTHARSGELGRAIASYLRAQRRAPRDGDIRRNLEWVRSHTRDLELVGQGLPPVIAQLDRIAHTLAVREWGLLLLVLSWLAALPVAWSWRQGVLESGLRRLVIGLVACVVAVGAVTTTRWYEEHWRRTAVVVVGEVEVRSGPATTFPELFRIHDGLTLQIRGEREGWSRVGLGGDWVGWVPTGTLESVDQGR